MKTILIIEDEPWQADVYRRQLKNYDVYAATNGYDGIRKIDECIPDAIVLDMLLSGSNAITLLHELQSHDDLAKIPIILVTNLADTLAEHTLKHYGVAELLDKTTIKWGEIVRAIEKVTT